MLSGSALATQKHALTEGQTGFRTILAVNVGLMGLLHVTAASISLLPILTGGANETGEGAERRRRV